MLVGLQASQSHTMAAQFILHIAHLVTSFLNIVIVYFFFGCQVKSDYTKKRQPLTERWERSESLAVPIGRCQDENTLKIFCGVL